MTVRVRKSVASELQLECSTGQRSCSGPVLYNLYAITLEKYVNILGYSNDHIIYENFKAGNINGETKISTIESGIDKIEVWM